MENTNKTNNSKTLGWKEFLLLCITVYPTLNIVHLIFAPLTKGWSMWLATLVTLPVTMVVSYIILPLCMRLFARWLKD